MEGRYITLRSISVAHALNNFLRERRDYSEKEYIIIMHAFIFITSFELFP